MQTTSIASIPTGPRPKAATVSPGRTSAPTPDLGLDVPGRHDLFCEHTVGPDVEGGAQRLVAADQLTAHGQHVGCGATRGQRYPEALVVEGGVRQLALERGM
ncbi:hypothetical protein [Nocardiopsis rhodophaea]|uniref:hypothetical protein n=1 Tax=Nocardiopsis rhodophaea TaxID=280238 RepID=UPI0031DC85AF